jgi:hypothetical protein
MNMNRKITTKMKMKNKIELKRTRTIGQKPWHRQGHPHGYEHRVIGKDMDMNINMK